MILRRLQGSRFSEVMNEWEGATAAILAGGESLTVERVAHASAAHAAGWIRCIAVNDAYLLAPFADVLYAADASWHANHAKGIEKLGLTAAEVRERYQGFPGQRCSVEDQLPQITDERIHVLRSRDFPIRSPSTNVAYVDGKLIAGRNSGHQAMNVAIRAGAKRILLLGFDAQGKHFHGGHGVPISDAFFRSMIQSFSFAEHALKDMGVEVLNCSPESAIESFPKVEIETVL